MHDPQDAQTARRELTCIVKIEMVKNCPVSEKNNWNNANLDNFTKSFHLKMPLLKAH